MDGILFKTELSPVLPQIFGQIIGALVGSMGHREYNFKYQKYNDTN